MSAASRTRRADDRPELEAIEQAGAIRVLRVANVIEDGRLAGPQLRILAVAQALKERGIDTTVVHPIREARKFAAALDAAGVERIALPLECLSRQLLPLLRYMLTFPVEVLRLHQLFRRGKFDLVHCSGGFWQVKALIAANLAGIPALWHMNDTLFPTRLRSAYLWVCRRFVDRLVFAGERVRLHYLGQQPCPAPFIEIQAPVNCSRFAPRPKARDARDGILRIITIGNVNPLKGLEDFIAMAAELSGRCPNLSFHVVGPVFDSQSKYFRELERLVAVRGLTNLHFHGAVADIPDVLLCADIYVCSSIAEASPTAVWEAMATAKAVVSTDVGDVARFVGRREAGVVTPIRDPQALAAAVERLVRDPKLRQKMGERARQVAIEELDISRCVRDHERAYRGDLIRANAG